MSRTCYPDEDNRPCSILLEMCQNVVRRRIKRTAHKIQDNRPCSILLEMCQNVVRRRIKRTAHKIQDQLNVSNCKSCHVYM